MNFRPLCTAIVWPTMSGMIVERRDQVLTTFFSRVVLRAATFLARWSGTKRPYLKDADIVPAFDWRRRMLQAFGWLFWRVFRPLVFQPHGEVGWRRPEVCPSRPPLG